MLTRSNHGSSSSSSSQQSQLYNNSIKYSSNSVLTRSRKRKSTSTVHDEEALSKISSSSHNSHRSSRHSISAIPSAVSVSSTGELREIQYNNLFPFPPPRNISIAHTSTSRRRLRTSSSRASSDTSSTRSFRRKLAENDYNNDDKFSSVSSSTSGSTFSSYTSSGSRTGSSSSYSTRRSSSRRSQSDEESVISGLSSVVEIGVGIEDVTPQSKYGLRSMKDSSSVLELPRSCSLPSVCFANCEEIWDLMCQIDLKYKRSPDIFKNHPNLGPSMRAILLDWIMDVCEAYKMHRETLYLAIDYLDRYLAVQKDVHKAHLQLIGITCLFVAAKLEEIYPPKLKTFAYVTDGACSEAEILTTELHLNQVLKWKLTPITPATWVNIYLQILAYRNGGNICTRSGADFLRASFYQTRVSDARLVKHLFDPRDYVKVIRLLDLIILDHQALNWTYSVLSAAAIFHIKGRQAALMASGFTVEQIMECVNWMGPAATVLRKHEIPTVLPSIEEVSDENRHLIQSHCITLDNLNDAMELAKSKICSPLNAISIGLLTPPSSGEKSGFNRRAKLSQSPRF